MSVDSVSGNEAAFARRVRRLQRERQRELDRIEAEKQRDVAEARKRRDNELQQLYENQADSVGEARREANDRIARAKQAADERIHNYEEEANSMADNARRQFQAKADLLKRNAQELDAQRRHLIKEQQADMDRLRQEHEQNTAHNQLKYRRESDRMHEMALKGYQRQRAEDRDQLAELKNEYAQRKEDAQEDAERQIRSIRRRRNDTAEDLKRQIDFYKQEGADELNSARAQNRKIRQKQQLAFSERMQNLSREGQSALNHAHVEGMRKLDEAQNFYNDQLQQAQRGDAKRIKAQVTQTQHELEALKDQQKNREFIATSTFNYRRHLEQQKRKQILADSYKRTEKMQKELSTEYHRQLKDLTAARENALDKETAEAQTDLHRQFDAGKKQLNQIMEKNAKTLGTYESLSGDPFYQLKNINAQVEHTASAVYVRIKIPKQEGKSVRVTLHHKMLSITGTRRSQEKMRAQDGSVSSSRSYQSYSEEIPIADHLDMNRMSRSYVGGVLTFMIPKS